MSGSVAEVFLGDVSRRASRFSVRVVGGGFLHLQGPLGRRRDVQTGAQTLLMKLGVGFRLTEPGFATTSEESYVLSGEFTIGDDRLGPEFFYSRPAGYVYGPVESSGGYVLYASFDGPLERRVATPAEVGTKIA